MPLKQKVLLNHQDFEVFSLVVVPSFFAQTVMGSHIGYPLWIVNTSRLVDNFYRT